MDIKTIIIDFDGVLTDGKINMSHSGEIFRSVHTRDIRAIRELIARGFEVVICTASSSPIIESYAEKVGAYLLVARDKSEVANVYEAGSYIAVGDDVWDIPLLKGATRAFCPADADPGIPQEVYRLNTNGGNGVIAELIRRLDLK
jgi:3-deoxy-D-manno-octulosonate 8-phosphate phosphatase (KDO 8-P phosphatase)